MGTTTLLLACARSVAQPAPAESSDWLILPRLGRGQELIYRGAFQEEALSSGVKLVRGYRLETRVFVLDSRPKGADLALYTVLKQRLQSSCVAAPPMHRRSSMVHRASMQTLFITSTILFLSGLGDRYLP